MNGYSQQSDIKIVWYGRMFLTNLPRLFKNIVACDRLESGRVRAPEKERRWSKLKITSCKELCSIEIAF